MNSQTLTKSGFSAFLPLRELSLAKLPKEEGHVLVLIDNTLSGKAESDILYIGRARKPARKVLGGYVGGFGGKTSKRINRALFNDGYIEKVSVGLMASKNPRTAQRELLERFRSEHGSYPVWNSPSKKSGKPEPKQEPVKLRGTRKSA
jgi:hypothetical protein